MQECIQKLYIEPTSHCNLACVMCPRNYWTDEMIGHMDYDLFKKAVSEAKDVRSIHTIFFGGVGEPLAHPDIIKMIKYGKETGKNVELITNGTLLTEDLINKIIDAKLDKIWVSIDSVEAARFNEIRKGADYKTIEDSLLIIKRMRRQNRIDLKLGMSFVLMKKNVAQLPKLVGFARKYRISEIIITNVIPNTLEMLDETLFNLTLSRQAVKNDIHIRFPFFDITQETKEPVYKLLRDYADYSLMGTPIERKYNYCKFIQEGNVFVRWDGEICPCMALLHSGTTYLYDWKRNIKYASFGNIAVNTILETWESKEYRTFRDKVRMFNFSPCTICGSCTLLENNKEDCLGNTFPVCGGCLWAQGLIQCP